MCHIAHLVVDVAVEGYDVWNPIALVIRSHEGHDPALGIIEKFIQQLPFVRKGKVAHVHHEEILMPCRPVGKY